jgi:hypothetical protein
MGTWIAGCKLEVCLMPRTNDVVRTSLGVLKLTQLPCGLRIVGHSLILIPNETQMCAQVVLTYWLY